MKYLPLIWANLWRKPTRTTLTVLSLAVGFTLFGLAYGIEAGMNAARARLSDARVRVVSRANLMEPLPVAHTGRIETIPGVSAVALATLFGGTYQDPKNAVASAAVDIRKFLEVFPEIRLPQEQLEAMERTRNGATAGSTLAQRYGWRVGDTITLRSSIWINKQGSRDWSFRLVGIHNASPGDDPLYANELYLNYRYLDEGRATGIGTVSTFAVRVSDPRQAAAVAQTIDQRFQNSAYETVTHGEKNFAQAQLRRLGDIEFFLRAIITAAVFALLVVNANAAMQSMRERTSDLGVMRALGFGGSKVLLLITAEGVLTATLAAVLGMAVVAMLFPQIFAALGLPPLGIPPIAVILTLLAAAACGLLTSLPPYWSARNLEVATALKVK
jgi:putative ABC transport system permease protein